MNGNTFAPLILSDYLFSKQSLSEISFIQFCKQSFLTSVFLPLVLFLAYLYNSISKNITCSTQSFSVIFFISIFICNEYFCSKIEF